MRPPTKQNLFCYMDVNGLTVDVKLSTRTVMFLYKVGNVTQIEAVETHTDIVTKDLVFDTPVTINGVEIKGLNYPCRHGQFHHRRDTPILIQAKSKANIGMEAASASKSTTRSCAWRTACSPARTNPRTIWAISCTTSSR